MPTQEEETKVRQSASMRYWWPKLQSCDVPTPKTTVIPVRDWSKATEITEGWPIPDIERIIEVVESHGTPAFIRTDQASDKHNMNSASKVPNSDHDTVKDHVSELLRFNKMAGFAGLPWRDIVVRDWLDLRHTFTAFNHTPIAAEIRVFLYQNEVKDYGFYWPEDAIEQYPPHTPELPSDWREQRDSLEEETLSKFEQIQPLAETVATEFDGYWSVDFAQTTSDTWQAIDMAPGIASWKPEGCTKPSGIQDLGLGDFEL